MQLISLSKTSELNKIEEKEIKMGNLYAMLQIKKVLNFQLFLLLFYKLIILTKQSMWLYK